MEIIRATYGMQYHLYFVALEGIPLLSDVGPENIGCWELSLNLSLTAQLFEHPVLKL